MNLAIIGTSKIAESYIKTFKLLGVKISAIHSRDIGRAKKIASKFNITKSTDNLDSILNDGSFDSAVLVTEPNRHIEIAEKLLLSKKNILIEKPIDINLNKVESFIKNANKSNAVIQIASQYYFDPIVQDFKKKFLLLDTSETGHMKINIFSKKNRDYFLNGNQWRKKYSNPIINQGIHWLDFIVDLFGVCQSEETIKENVSRFGNSFDSVISILKFENNKFVTINASTNIKYEKSFFTYNSPNLNYSYKYNFISKLIFNPYNIIKFRSSYRHYLQCKNFINNVNRGTNDNSLYRAHESLKLANIILS